MPSLQQNWRKRQNREQMWGGMAQTMYVNMNK
jgi:hypothetical protein